MKYVSLRTLAAMLCSLFFAFPVVAGEQLGGYHLLKKVPLGTAAKGAQREYFDYITVDASERRVYLSHGTPRGERGRQCGDRCDSWIETGPRDSVAERP